MLRGSVQWKWRIIGSTVWDVDLVCLDNRVLLFRLRYIGVQREREIWEVRGNVEVAGPDLMSWIAGYRTPAAKPGCRRQWMGKMSFSGILGQASFKQMKKRNGRRIFTTTMRALMETLTGPDLRRG